MEAERLDIRPVPDPTTLTTAQLLRELATQKELIFARLDALEDKVAANRANTLAEAEKTRQHLTLVRELYEEKISAVQTLLSHITQSQQREVGTAFEAQKEAAAARDTANQKAIDKSEQSTAETLRALGTLVQNQTDALRAQITDVKDRMTRIEGQDTGKSATWAYLLAGIGAFGTLIGIVAVILEVARTVK